MRRFKISLDWHDDNPRPGWAYVIVAIAIGSAVFAAVLLR